MKRGMSRGKNILGIPAVGDSRRQTSMFKEKQEVLSGWAGVSEWARCWWVGFMSNQVGPVD